MKQSRQRRRHPAHAAVFVFTLCMAGAPAAVDAATINLGVISFDALVPGEVLFPGVNAINIANLTGDPLFGGFALPPDFSSLTPVSFLDSSLTLVVDGVSQPPLGLGAIEPGFLNPSSFPDTMILSSLIFSATLSTASFLLADGSTFLADSAALSLTLLPSFGTALVAGVDLGVLTVEGEIIPAPVPEPGTLLLLATGLVGVGIRRAQRSKRPHLRSAPRL